MTRKSWRSRCKTAPEGRCFFFHGGHKWRALELFTAWAKENDVKKMENVTQELVREYGRDLAEKVSAGDLAATDGQNYISAVNSVMTIATKGEWQSVSPTKDCGIEQRCAVRTDAPGALDRAAYGRAVEVVREQVGERAGAVVELARDTGLQQGLFAGCTRGAGRGPATRGCDHHRGQQGRSGA